MRSGEVLEVVRICWGVTQLIAAPSIARCLLGETPDELTVRALRVLGTRQAIQAAILGTSRSRSRHVLGGGVDAIHAASMIIVAVVSPQRRRAALTELVTASAFAAAEVSFS